MTESIASAVEEQLAPPPYLYAILRKEMTGGAFLSQFGHAVTECLTPDVVPLPADTRIAVLGASKEQLAAIRGALEGAGIRHKLITEVDGVLKDVDTAIGLFTRDRAELVRQVPLIAELKSFSGKPPVPGDALAALRRAAEEHEKLLLLADKAPATAERMRQTIAAVGKAARAALKNLPPTT